MSDEQITDEQVVAQAVAPFVETVGDAAEAATAVLEALREAGFDVYRSEGCPLVIERNTDGSWPDWVLVGLGWTLDDSHDLPAVMDGVWRERPR